MRLIIPIIVMGLCIGMYFVYISPTIADVKSLKMTKTDYEEVLLKSKEVASLRDDLFTQYNNIPALDIERLNKIIPKSFNSVTFANDINALASRNNLGIKDFKVDPLVTESKESINQQGGDAYKTTVITFRMNGEYSQFVNFLTQVESSLQLMDIIRLSVKVVGGEKSTDNSLEYLLEMNTYSLE